MCVFVNERLAFIMYVCTHLHIYTCVCVCAWIYHNLPIESSFRNEFPLLTSDGSPPAPTAQQQTALQPRQKPQVANQTWKLCPIEIDDENEHYNLPSNIE